jgi:hypothetical protein
MTLEVLRELVCENQLGIAQYHFLANERHRDLKDALTSFSASSRVSDHQLVARKMFALEHYLYVELKKFFEISCKQVEKLFTSRHPDSNLPLRFCIKIINGDSLITVFRYPESRIRETTNKIRTDNTAFQGIADGKSYYLCNNIPEYIRSDSYRNTRINRDRVIELFAGGQSFSNTIGGDETWCSCWKDVVMYSGQRESTERPPASSDG